MRSGRYIGVMSGTSLDGVDVVLAAIDENMVAQQASLSWPIPVELKQAVLDICRGQQLTLSQFGQLDTRLGILFADAVNGLLAQENLQPQDIVAIGCHGQTVWHEPQGPAPHTLQIGDNNQIVARTGITVVGDFRRRDIALGGQGAPLVLSVSSCPVSTSYRTTDGAKYWGYCQSVNASPRSTSTGLRHRVTVTC